MPAKKRVEFPQAVRRKVKDAAGGFCSMTGCYRPCTSKSKNIAVLAHILPASTNGPRGIGKIDADILKSESNAIFLCSVCSIKIDQTPEQYPIELLEEMKFIREYGQDLVVDSPELCTYKQIDISLVSEEIRKKVKFLMKNQNLHIINHGLSNAILQAHKSRDNKFRNEVIGDISNLLNISEFRTNPITKALTQVKFESSYSYYLGKHWSEKITNLLKSKASLTNKLEATVTEHNNSTLVDMSKYDRILDHYAIKGLHFYNNTFLGSKLWNAIHPFFKITGFIYNDKPSTIKGQLKSIANTSSDSSFIYEHLTLKTIEQLEALIKVLSTKNKIGLLVGKQEGALNTLPIPIDVSFNTTDLLKFQSQLENLRFGFEVAKEYGFVIAPESILNLKHTPDDTIKELCFRYYEEIKKFNAYPTEFFDDKTKTRIIMKKKPIRIKFEDNAGDLLTQVKFIKDRLS